jgi:hypothetical protein
MPDHLTLPGATALAKRIRDFWAAQGKTVRTRIEGYGPINANGTHSVFAVRSDMINGAPRNS